MTRPRGAAAGLALMLVVLAGPAVRGASAWAMLGVVAGLLVALAAAAVPTRWGAWALALGAVAVFAVAVVSPCEAMGPLARWFSTHGGLFYWNPVIWLGLAGVFVAPVRAAVGLALVAAGVYAFSPPGTGSSAALEAAVPATLWPAIAAVLEGARRSAAAVPIAWIGAGGLALTLSNLLLMEQYRRHLIPRDDTVSFAEVSRTSDALFCRAFGNPRTWPASWVFAWRHRVAPGRYDEIAGAPWRLEAAEAEVIDLPAGPVEPSWIALRSPRTIDVLLEGSGDGEVEIRVNGRRAAAVPLSPSGGEARVRVAAIYWRRGLNAVRLVPGPATQAAWTRLTVRRSGGGV